MQPHRVQRRKPMFPISIVLATLMLSLVLAALAVPLGAAAADDKEDAAQQGRRVEPTDQPMVVGVVAAPAAEAEIVVETPPADGGGSDPQSVLALETIPPEPPCPPGFVPAEPPLNPDLGCIANTIAANPATSPVEVVDVAEPVHSDPACPPGFKLALPPLNPDLGCIADSVTSVTGTGGVVAVVGLDESAHPDPCPPGWVPVQPPVNPEIGCINNTAGTATGASGTGDGTGIVFVGERIPECPPGWVPMWSPRNEFLGCIKDLPDLPGGDGSQPAPAPGVWGGDDSLHHPGHCPEGYVLKLLLKQNPDGSLTFSYGCVQESGGIVTGPTDFAINDTAGTDSSQVMFVGNGGSLEHPGHCAEGYVYALVLRENADGSYTWLYTCVPDGSDPGPWGGDGGPHEALQAGYPKFDGVSGDW